MCVNEEENEDMTKPALDLSAPLTTHYEMFKLDTEGLEGHTEDGKIKDERSNILLKLSNDNEKKYNEKYIGKELEVLFEEEKNNYYQGHTANYILVKCKSDKNLNENIYKVKGIKAENDCIIAEI